MKTINIKIIIWIMVYLVCFASLFASRKGTQAQSEPLLYINHIDFSEYPDVNLYVTITDEYGEGIDLNEIGQQNISISQNLNPMSIIRTENLMELKDKGTEELYISLVIDNSFSMNRRISFLDKAVEGFIQKLGPSDYVSIFDFAQGGSGKSFIRKFTSTPSASFKPQSESGIATIASNISSQVNEDEYYVNMINHIKQRVDFTNSKRILLENSKAEYLTSMTYLYDSILVGMYRLNNYIESGKKFLVVFSDGMDTSSITDYDIIKKYVDEYQIPVYAVDLNTRENNFLKQIALDSGGDYFFTRSEKDLEGLYEQIFKILNNQWKITCRVDLEQGISTDQILSNKLSYTMSIDKPFSVSTTRYVEIFGDNIAYQSLLNLENTGIVREIDYLNFLATWETSSLYNRVMLRLGAFYTRRGEYDKALSCYNIILRDNAASEFSEALMSKGNLFMEQQEYSSATNLYRRALSSSYIEPVTMAKLQMELARSYTAEGEYSAALDSYSQLVSQYRGTEYAADALISSALIHMEMGQLDEANLKINEVLSFYPESKSAVYAKIELSNIQIQIDDLYADDTEAVKEVTLDTSMRTRSVEENYLDIINSRNVDKDIKDEYLMRLGNHYIQEKRFSEALEILEPIVNNQNTSDHIRISSAKNLIDAHYGMGNPMNAGQAFYSLPEEFQLFLLMDNSISVTSIGGSSYLGLCNGTLVTMPPAGISITANDMKIIEQNDDFSKFDVIGSFQSFSDRLIDSNVYFYIPQEMLANQTIIPGISGVYYFVNNQWQVVNSFFDEEKSAFGFKCENPGVYCVMARPPKLITLFNINFAVNKADLTKDSEPFLFQIIDELKEMPDVRLEIAGHTDNTGSAEHNQKLSEDRAESVKRFIVSNGIEANRISTKGYGFRKPLVPNNSEANMAKNRRTEFMITSSVFVQTFDKAQETGRFAVYLNTYNSAKRAIDEKKFYERIGYKPRLVMNEDDKNAYILYLAVVNSRAEAQQIADNIVKEYRSLNPRVVTLN